MPKQSPINDLTASQWLFRSKSVMKRNFGSGKFAHKIRRQFNKSCKPPELCRDIVENLSKKGDLVFDPFAGTGGVLIGAQMAERTAKGCELDPQQIMAYKAACSEINGLWGSYDPDVVQQGNCLDLYSACETPFVDFLLTDPPWFDLDERRKSSRWMKGKGSLARPMKPYGTCHFDSLGDWGFFLAKFAAMAKTVVKPGKYLAYFMEDAYLDGEYIFLTDISRKIVSDAGFVPQGEWIWYNEARRACFFGYPSRMITSRTHTSILFFKNESKGEK